MRAVTYEAGRGSGELLLRDIRLSAVVSANDSADPGPSDDSRCTRSYFAGGALVCGGGVSTTELLGLTLITRTKQQGNRMSSKQVVVN